MINNINLTGMTDWTLTSLDSYIVGLSMVTTKSQFGWRCYSVEKVGLYALWSVQGLCFLPSCHPLVSWCLGWRGTVFQGMGVWSQLCPMSFALLLWLNCWRCWVADEESQPAILPPADHADAICPLFPGSQLILKLLFRMLSCNKKKRFQIIFIHYWTKWRLIKLLSLLLL